MQSDTQSLSCTVVLYVVRRYNNKKRPIFITVFFLFVGVGFDHRKIPSNSSKLILLAGRLPSVVWRVCMSAQEVAK